VTATDESRPGERAAFEDNGSEDILPKRQPRRRIKWPDTERTGWKRPRSDREGPHPVYIDADAYRVICRECSWFWSRRGATPYELRQVGKRHRANMREAS